MKNYFRSRFIQITVLVASVLFVYGCTTTTSAQISDSPEPSSLPTASPTEIPEPVQKTDSAVQTVLTAHEASVTVFNDEDSEAELGSGEAINLPTGDRIKLDTAGRGVLLIADRHQIDLFGGTEFQLDEAILESGGSTFVRLNQIAGHIHILLDEQAIARLTLETVDSTITTLEQGTEFTVCYAPGKVTCIAVQEGVIEVTSENEKRLYKKGEATYFEPGQPPQPPICVKEDEFSDWFARKWGPGEAEALGALVSSWPQEPCILTDTLQSTATNMATAELVTDTQISTQEQGEVQNPSTTAGPTDTPWPTNTPEPQPSVNRITIRNTTSDDLYIFMNGSYLGGPIPPNMYMWFNIPGGTVSIKGCWNQNGTDCTSAKTVTVEGEVTITLP